MNSSLEIKDNVPLMNINNYQKSINSINKYKKHNKSTINLVNLSQNLDLFVTPKPTV